MAFGEGECVVDDLGDLSGGSRTGGPYVCKQEITLLVEINNFELM